MMEGMLNTKEVAQYLGIHEKQVYALIKAKKIPATRVTGKWIFPKKLIDDWILLHAQKGLEQARQKSRKIEGAFYAFPNVSGTGMSSVQFADLLLNKAGIAVTPGAAFGDSGEGHNRLSFAHSTALIEKAIVKMQHLL